MKCWALTAIVVGSAVLPSMADESKPTISSLLAAGGDVKAVQTSQEWPVFYITTPDKRMFACSMDYDQGYKFFDARQPVPASVATRCSELK
jgi:hypothetical protein